MHCLKKKNRMGLNVLELGGSGRTKEIQGSSNLVPIPGGEKDIIYGLQDEHGVWTSDPCDTDHMVRMLYIDLFSSEGSREMVVGFSFEQWSTSLPEWAKNKLERPFLASEVESALHQMRSTKARARMV